ncbi:MAG TPA: glucuronate isomerase [Microthrixaceae bacterium]|nr:glucuronate isomerase [Microthrixaceae bacterium]
MVTNAPRQGKRRPLRLHSDRLFPAEPTTRAIARELFAQVEQLPIVSPHGHCDPRWWADNQPFTDPASLLVTGDHYLLRMLHSQGVPLESLGVRPLSGNGDAADPREVWRTFASHYDLFLGTPSRLWLDHALKEVLGVEIVPSAATADETYDHIAARLAEADCRPRALFDRFNIEFLATTESPLDNLQAHRAIRTSGWNGQVVTAFRPDPVVDPDRPDFLANLDELAELTGCDTTSWTGYLEALVARRRFFIAHGATSTDHGHPSATTADLTPSDATELFARVRSGKHDPVDAELFRGQMLTEMVRMSLDDGLVVQLHPGCHRSHNPGLQERFGPDIGADFPARGEFISALKPLLDRFGNEPGLTLVLFTLDESNYSRELAPLAGHYPLLKLGAPWWFHDSVEGIRRFRETTTESAGFANTVGFTDDTRALLSIPARHDLSRRVDCGYLAGLVAEHRLEMDDAADLAVDLAYRLARDVYRVDDSRFTAADYLPTSGSAEADAHDALKTDPDTGQVTDR